MLMFLTFAAMLALLAVGSHVAVAMGVVTTALVLMVQGVPMAVIAQTAFKSVNSYALMAIPLFVLAGNLMMRGNIAGMLIDLIGTLVRAVRGGLALTVMIACVFFAAISGSSVGSAAAIGSAVVTGLKDDGYPARFAAGIVAVGGTLGLMIPPSLGFILIGSIVGLPVDRLFIAGVLPGLMEAALLMLALAYLTRRHGYGRTIARPDLRGFASRLPKAAPVIVMPVLVIGSIYTGYLTPTEVSAFAAAYAALLCLRVYRTIDLRGAWSVVQESLLQTTMIFAIVMGGSLVGFMMARMGVSAAIVDAIVAAEMAPWQFLLLANVTLLILGMFIDGVAMIVLTSPLLFPVAMSLGMNPVHFAVIMVANVEIATLTPPVGLNLFVISGVAKLPVHEVVRGVAPFYAVRLVALALISYVPAISLALL